MGQQLTYLQRRLRRNDRVRPATEQDERLRPERERVTAWQSQLSTLREFFLRTSRRRVNELNQLEMRLSEQVRQMTEQEERLRAEQEQVTVLQSQLSASNEVITTYRQREIEWQQEETILRDIQEQLRLQVRELQNQLSTKEGELISMRESFQANTVTPLANTIAERGQGEQIRIGQQPVVGERRTESDLNPLRIGTQRGRRANPAGQRRQLSEPQQRVNDPPDWVINRNAREFQIFRNQELGRGAWGVVYRGTFCRCDVAVKEMHEGILSTENRASFEREVDIAARCRHPCLLQFIGATTDGMAPLLVTEIMDCTLRSRLRYNEGEQALCEAEIVAISLDVAHALNYLHQKRPSPIIHSDISSANVLLWRQGGRWKGKVSDYGTANFVRRSTRNYPGAIIYSAPEYLNEAHNQLVMISCKVDVYSFGVLLCEMSIREMPDPQRRAIQIPRMTNLELRYLASRCTLQEPGERPNMEEIIDELEAAL